MGYNEFILIVNAVSIIILFVMAFLLCFAARFKGESSYAALIIVLTTVPIYCYNLCCNMEWYEVAIFFAPLAFSLNLTLMPLLWLLTQRGFNPHYCFTHHRLLHFLPAVVMLLLYCVGAVTWLVYVNYLLFLVQIIGYLFIIFRYLRRVKMYVRNHYSVAELRRKVWIPRFIALLAASFVIEVVCFAFLSQIKEWLPQLLNVVAMSYLLYSELEVALSSRFRQEPDAAFVADAKAEFTALEEEVYPKIANRKEDMGQLFVYARQVEEYLRTSEVFVNPNLSLKDVSKATGISTNNLSKAINTALGKNFFDLVNGFRVEKSKALLLLKKEKGFTLETIAEQCGFNSQVTFCNAFKKALGITTTQWLKSVKER